ncbi:hypothetical protein C0708_22100 [Aeromonas caviae]|nr:hypothetical protein C0708_22100 [Aeromonas caviae]
MTLSAGTQVGDLLVVKDGAGTALFSGQVTAEMLKDGLGDLLVVKDGRALRCSAAR